MSTMESWRLVVSGAQPGAENMALDEAILESVAAGEMPATLRLYAWQPACLSLGYAQPIADVDLDQLARRGWDLVRRPTGGRAILHTDEITYAVAASDGDRRMAGGVLPSYQRLSRALLGALADLGLDARTEPAPGDGRAQPADPVCFQTPSAYEITVTGRKLIGSAQVRRRGGVLQHGSLPLGGDIGRICTVLALGTPDERLAAALSLRARATTAEQALGRRVGWDEAAQALVSGFERELALRLEPGGLSRKEQTRAAELVGQRYVHAGWTGRH